MKQGDVLATAGKSQLANTEQAQLYFEIRKNAQPINPSEYFGQPVTSIEDKATETTEDEVTSDQTDEQDESREDEATEDETNADETREDETNNKEE